MVGNPWLAALAAAQSRAPQEPNMSSAAEPPPPAPAGPPPPPPPPDALPPGAFDVPRPGQPLPRDPNQIAAEEVSDAGRRAAGALKDTPSQGDDKPRVSIMKTQQEMADDAGSRSAADRILGRNKERDEGPGSPGSAPPQDMGAAASGGGGSAGTPGGFYPNTMERDIHHGKPVPAEVRRAYGAAAGLEANAAGIDADANKELYKHLRGAHEAQLAANQDAIQSHANLQREREMATAERMERINALNKQAQGSPQDLWNDRQALAGFIGLLSSVVGFASRSPALAFAGGSMKNMIDGFVNQDINSKLADRKGARESAKAETDLLDLHLKDLDSRDKAIDATRLAYYESALQQLEQYRADHKVSTEDAGYQKALGGILEARAKTEERLSGREAADVTDKLTQKYHMPTAGGAGAGPKLKDIPNQIKLGDRTVYTVPNDPLYQKAAARITMMQSLQQKNLEILQIRQEMEKKGWGPYSNPQEYNAAIGKLNNLQRDKMNAISIAAEQGVNTKSDTEREEKYGTSATSGFGNIETSIDGAPWIGARIAAQRRAANDVLRAEVARADKEQHDLVKGLGGRIIETGYNRDPVTGELSPVARHTGQDGSPSQALPAKGSRPQDRRVGDYPTQPDSDRDTTPKAPVLSQTHATAAVDAAKKRSHKKKE